MNTRDFLMTAGAWMLAATCTIGSEGGAEDRPNVLLIMCDDLNDYVSGFGGHPQAKTPAVEKLAASGTLFSRTYCNFPACVPSRNSMIHGIYPHNASSAWEDWSELAGFKGNKTMMAYFKENGYTVIGSGKVEHNATPSEWTTFYHKPDYGPIWHQDGKSAAHPDVKAPYRDVGKLDGSFGSIESALRSNPGKGNGWYYYTPIQAKAKAMPIEQDPELGWMTPDTRNAQLMKNLLEGKTKGLKEPFFLAVGFVRPHTPLHVEEKYFSQFPLDSLKLEPIKQGDAEDTYLKDLHSRKAVHGYRHYDAIKAAYGADEKGLKLFVQAYLASIASVDENIGKVMSALDKSKYKENTIVILTSDNGYQMGEKEWLFKNSPWEESIRLPMIVRAPGVTTPGTTCNKPVSLVDIYPTLRDLCGLKGPVKKTPTGRKLDGHSMKPFLEDPVNGKWSGPEVALTLVKPENSNKPGDESTNHFSVRSARYRYIRYNNGKEELYDHDNDPYEWTNLATNKEFDAVRKQHLEALNKLTGFTF